MNTYFVTVSPFDYLENYKILDFNKEIRQFNKCLVEGDKLREALMQHVENLVEELNAKYPDDKPLRSARYKEYGIFVEKEGVNCGCVLRTIYPEYSLSCDKNGDLSLIANVRFEE